jgi:hypothetical protein
LVEEENEFYKINIEALFDVGAPND